MPLYQHLQYELHYLEKGSGKPVILLHGLGSHCQDWSYQIAVLSKEFRVIAPDFRGHGKSAASTSPMSIGDLAADVVALIKKLNITECQLVGFSLGGMVAFELALLLPNVVTGMVIVNSGPEVGAKGLTLKLLLAFRLTTIRLLGMRRLGLILAKKLFDETKHAHLISAFAKQMALTDATTYRYVLRAISEFSVMSRLSELAFPILVIAADQDYTPVDAKRAFVSKLTNAKLIVIEQSRHATPLDQPEALNDHLLSFLLAGLESDAAIKSTNANS